MELAILSPADMETAMDKLEQLLIQAAEALAARECGHCFHPYHGTVECEHTRTLYCDGITVDGPCGCKGEEVGYDHR